ncbi:MAG: methyltransferase domain-containing protein [Anaerolineae bacterium]|nr:methyltransferase domain-containing protein [Anaerolineae bacterium]
MSNIREVQPYYTSFKYSLRRYYVDRFMNEQAGALREGSTVLDVGGQRENSRGQFQIEQYPVRTTFLNLIAEKKPDVQADGAGIPFPDGQFDAVLCSEVLEHVPQPVGLVTEMARVLKPGGRIVITGPFLYGFHSDPDDYGRYTHIYWREVLTRAGFSDIVITRQGLFSSVMVELARAWLNYEYGRGRFRMRGIRGLVTRTFGWLRKRALTLDADPARHEHPFQQNYTTGYGITATRRSGQG